MKREYTIEIPGELYFCHKTMTSKKKILKFARELCEEGWNGLTVYVYDCVGYPDRIATYKRCENRVKRVNKMRKYSYLIEFSGSNRQIECTNKRDAIATARSECAQWYIGATVTVRQITSGLGREVCLRTYTRKGHAQKATLLGCAQ